MNVGGIEVEKPVYSTEFVLGIVLFNPPISLKAHLNVGANRWSKLSTVKILTIEGYISLFSPSVFSASQMSILEKKCREI